MIGLGISLVAAIVAAPSVSSATPGASTPGSPSGDGVTPVVLSGNVTCAQLNADEVNFPTVTRDFGVKVEPVTSGTYYFTSADATLEGGQPDDPYNYVTLSNVSGGYFDWAASLDIQAVIVKGGSDSNTFVYFPEDVNDTGLHAPINPDTGQPYGLSHVTFCHNYDMNATLNARVDYTRYYYWTIDKSVSPASRSGFAGQDLSYEYSVVAQWDYYEDADWAVAGTVEIANPSPLTVDFTAAGTFDGAGNDLTIDCPSYTLAPDSEVLCDISFMPTSDPDGETVSVDVTSLTTEVNGASTTDTLVTGLPTTVVNDTVNVHDTWPWSETAEHEELGAVFEYGEFNYSRIYTCPTDPAEYTDGVFTTSIVNRADIHETGQYDEASIEAICYQPWATKDAVATRGVSHEWSVEKSVDPTSITGAPGEELNWDWTVDVSETVSATTYSVLGTITVNNPNPTESATVVVTDELDDGTVATVDCNAGTPGNQSTVTVSAGGFVLCTYSAEPEDDSATLNTATITYGDDLTVTATAEVTWNTNELGVTADLSDIALGLDETLTAGEGPWTFDGAGSGHTCATSSSAYGADGLYTGSDSNTAILVVTDGPTVTSSATVDYQCETGYFDVLKYVDGVVDPATGFNFALYEGPDGFGSTPMATATSAGDADGVLPFGVPTLDLGGTYTVCELATPVGYDPVWSVGGEPVIPYNPDASSMEDYGNRCVDFGVDTSWPMTLGEVLRFEIDNQLVPLGHAPRSPGYWKNWTMYSKGNQAQTAANNGGWENGFWLTENVIDQTIGGGIRWDDILSDTFPSFWLTTHQALEILDMRVVTLNAIIGDGKKLASDPARQLGRNLLAAQLNVGSGACTTPAVLAAIVQAETLLDKYDFDGKLASAYSIGKRGADAALARTLSGYLDQYNNGMICSGS
ncbi:MAG: hypothetical protein B7C54_07110 [Acidimicrobiales bacterium mtb01]|nr:MAG: hypothetical protein B7C54_07110 [Acidimicrobiales bacterium mtb01]